MRAGLLLGVRDVTAHQDALAPDLGVMDLPEASTEAGLRDHLVVVVEDTPVPQGSKTRYGKRVVEDNEKLLAPWREAVKAAARLAIEEMHPDAARPLFGEGVPVEVEITFTFNRAGNHFGTGRNAGVLKAWAPRWRAMTPDVDKLARGVLDALTAAGVWKDDAQAVSLLARKVYPGGHGDALPIPGAVIRIRAVAP